MGDQHAHHEQAHDHIEVPKHGEWDRPDIQVSDLPASAIGQQDREACAVEKFAQCPQPEVETAGRLAIHGLGHGIRHKQMHSTSYLRIVGDHGKVKPFRQVLPLEEIMGKDQRMMELAGLVHGTVELEVDSSGIAKATLSVSWIAKENQEATWEALATGVVGRSYQIFTALWRAGTT